MSAPEEPLEGGGLRGLDAIGWAIATMHGLLGHDLTALVMVSYAGAGVFPRSACLLCAFEREPTEQTRRAVIVALRRPL